MRYQFTDFEWAAIRSFLPNKPRGIPCVDDRRVLNGNFWVLRSGAPWRDPPEPPLIAMARNRDRRIILGQADGPEHLEVLKACLGPRRGDPG